MNQQRPKANFEERLLDRLQEVVAARGAAEADSGVPAVTPARWRPKPPLALAGAGVLAAIVIGILVFSSGPTAQTAAARILRETAAVAAATDAPAKIPGPGQFYYRKFKRLELQSWIPGGGTMGGGIMTRPGAFAALMPTTQEWWDAADGSGRIREVAGTPRFLTEQERKRWEAAGSRLPAPFDPEYQRKYPVAFDDALELRRGVVDRERPALEGFRFPDTSALPTEPEELRRSIEDNRVPVRGFNPMNPGAKRLDDEKTAAQLLNILQEGNPMSPALRAAIFNALAELSSIEVDTDASDFLGRAGYSIRLLDRKSRGGSEFIFDPDTAEVLAQREFIGKPGRSPYLKGLPAGLTIRETAYLGAGIVDSTQQTVPEAGAEKEGPRAHPVVMPDGPS